MKRLLSSFSRGTSLRSSSTSNGKTSRWLVIPWEVYIVSWKCNLIYAELVENITGVVAQQMLVLPFHPTHPVHLPCHVSHLVLACTRSVVHAETGLKVAPASVTLTREQKIAAARRIVGACLDPDWIGQNAARFEYVFKRATNPLL